MTLTRGTASPGSFTYEQPSADVLVLNGSLEGRKVEMQARLYDRNNFLLVTRGFHWVQEYPFNR